MQDNVKAKDSFEIYSFLIETHIRWQDEAALTKDDKKVITQTTTEGLHLNKATRSLIPKIWLKIKRKIKAFYNKEQL